jgi:CheY-like chemotaxis protein
LSSNPRASVLVLEDDDLSRTMARGILRSAGFKVICARDFREAFSYIKSNAKIDIALVDVVLPPGSPSGISFARIVQTRRPSMKVIFMSANIRSENLMRFEDGDILLYKPFAPNHLLEVVARATA